MGKNEECTVKVKSSVKQAEAELGRSYPLYSEMKFASKTENGSGPKNNRETQIRFRRLFILVTAVNQRNQTLKLV